MRQRFYHLIILWIFVLLTGVRCQGLERVSAIDAQASIASFQEIAPLVKAMTNEAVERVVLVPYDPSKLGKKSFSAHIDSNSVVLSAAKSYADRIIPFPALYLDDMDRVTYLSTLIQEGAKGMVIRRSRQLPTTVSLEDPIYGLIENARIPVMISVMAPDELISLERILSTYPKLTVICEEWCGQSNKLSRLESLLVAHSNLYISTGITDASLERMMLRLSQDSEMVRPLIEKYPSRFLFATGMTAIPQTTSDSTTISDRIIGARRFLEKAHYDYPILTRKWKNRGMRFPVDGALNGLFLSPDVLKKVYRENMLSILSASAGK